MVDACREMGYEPHLLCPQGLPDSDEIPCAVLVKGWVDDEVTVELVASVATAARAILAGDDPATIPEGVDAKAVWNGFIIY
jgi:hypothetical protein